MANKKVLLESAVQAVRDAFNAAVAGLGVGATLDPEDDEAAVSGRAVDDYVGSTIDFATDVKRKGKNLADQDAILPDTYYSTGGAQGSLTGWRCLPLIPIEPNSVYTISGINTTFIGNVYSSDNDLGNNVTQALSDNTGTYKKVSFTTGPNAAFVGINVASGTGFVADSVQLEPNSKKTAYQPYIRNAVNSGNIYPDIGSHPTYYEYDADGHNGEGMFTIYVNLQGSRYAGFNIIHSVNSSNRADLWRIRKAGIYTKIGGVLEPNDVAVLQGGESEFVIRQNGKTDFTGGFHGDEKLLNVYFYADGLPVSTSVDIPLSSCKSFSYLQLSELFETDNATDNVIAEHHKHTQFKAGGYRTFNRVDWQTSIDVDIACFGICSVSPDISDFFYSDDRPRINANEDGQEKINQTGGKTINYFSQQNSISASVSSEVTAAYLGADDYTNLYNNDSVNLVVWDRPEYAKYYRRLLDKTTAIGEIWEGYMEFTLS